MVEGGLELPLVLGMVMCLLELREGRLLDVVGVHRTRQTTPQPAQAAPGCHHAVLVGLGLRYEHLVALAGGERVGTRLADRQGGRGGDALGRAPGGGALRTAEE